MLKRLIVAKSTKAEDPLKVGDRVRIVDGRHGNVIKIEGTGYYVSWSDTRKPTRFRRDDLIKINR